MTKILSPFTAIATVLGVLLHAGAAQATSPRTWVASTGNDANLCTRSAPCLTFNGAYAQTTPGGEIDVLDGGDFGFLEIGHAITIANDGAGTAAITPAAVGFAITAGANDVVVLRGLTMNGIAQSNPAAAVAFLTGASLLIDHCAFQGFQTDPAIAFAPNSVGAPKLWVKDTVISNSGSSAFGSILISNLNSGGAAANLERVQIFGAIGNGVRADTSGGAGAIDVELHDVTVDGAAGGSGIVAVSAASGGSPVTLVADNVTSSHNAGYGLRAVGGMAAVYLGRSTITNNSVGIRASGGGAIVSYSDNRFANNSGGDGAPTSMMALK